MADLTGSTLTIPPVGFSGLSGLTPVAFQLLTPATATTATAAVSSSSTIVQVSGSGLLLSAIADFRDTLTSLQTDQVGGNPPDALTQARGLVDAFNQLQGDIDGLQTSFGALTGSLQVDSLALTVNQLATTAIASGSSNLANLSAIGIELQATVSPLSGAPSLALNLDETTLTAAQAANPATTQALLTQATQAFLAPLAEFDAQVASAAITQTTSTLTELGSAGAQAIDLNAVLQVNTPTTQSGLAIPTDVLAQLPADSVLNNVPLSDLDLAAVDLDADTLLSANDVLRGTLATTLLATTGATENLPTTALAATTNPLPGLTTTPATATATTASATPALTTETTAPAASTTATTTALTTTDASAAERRSAAATQALQNLLNDPTRRSISTNLFDPAYSALIAASHLSDFVAPAPDIRALSLPTETPAPVSAATLARAIGEYQETGRAGMAGRLR